MKKCYCEGIKMGTFDATVPMKTPQGKIVGIDACLATEIAWLWLKRIETIESCCGHNKEVSYIAVSDKCVQVMRDLGYENQCECDDEDCHKKNCFTAKLY